MNDADTWWLSLANIVLGAGVLLCLLVVTAAATYDAIKRRLGPHTS